ncbi:MAG: hypothetical protein K8I82_15785 [Anaerolineae bacterium]|nr:hypothetical protein [Anaerolineae bacterium]
MMRPNPYMLLMTALDFTVTDLAENRRGRLSKRQRAYLMRQSWSVLGGRVALLVVLILGGWVFGVHSLIWLTAAAIVLVTLVVIGRSLNTDLQGMVRATDGTVRVVGDSFLPLISRHHLVVGGQQFTVSEQVGQGFATDRSYRIYYTTGTRTILSGELLR